MIFASILLLALAPIQTALGLHLPQDFFGGENHQDYLEWVGTADYDSAMFISSVTDPSAGAAIHWTLAGDYIELGIAVRASGWLGFGLSDNGGMTGSDMLLFEAANPTVVKDAFVTEERDPQEDDCQDWEFVNATTDTDFLIVEVRRKLDTGDLQDWRIRDDSNPGVPVHRVIAAWGDNEQVSYHGPNNARGAVRWYDLFDDEFAVFAQAMDEDSNGNFFAGASNYTIKPVETEYKKFCVTGNDLRARGVDLDAGVTAISFEPLVDNVEHVHHFVLYASMEENNEDCDPDTIFEVAYVWAPGDPPLTLPDDVGYALGGDSGYRSFAIEIHYDNPSLKQGEMDSSGVRLYYSEEPRKYAAGVMIVGDSVVTLAGESIPRGLSNFNFKCGSECSALALDEPVTVVREFAHMHQSGVSSYTEQIRDGEVIRTGHADYFDFYHQGTHAIQQEPYQIQPGDSFNTACFYRNSDDGRQFGLASGDEMCMTFLLYFPRKEVAPGFQWMCGVGFSEMGLEACESTWDSAVLQDDESMNRVFGTPSTECKADTVTSSASKVVAGALSLSAGVLVLVL